jgi:hypothetical protein
MATEEMTPKIFSIEITIFLTQQEKHGVQIKLPQIKLN